MANDYNQLRNKIRMNYFGKFYRNTISLCKKYYKLIRRFRRKEYEDIRDDLFFINLYMAKCYKKIKDIKKAIHYVKVSIRFATNDTYLNEARFLLGKCYACRGNPRKAINNFQQCIYFHHLIDNKNDRAKVLFQMAKVLGKPNHMQKLVKIMENLNDNTDTVRNSYIKLIQYYLNNNNLKDAILLIGSIKNVNIQQQLLNTIRQMPQIA